MFKILLWAIMIVFVYMTYVRIKTDVVKLKKAKNTKTKIKRIMSIVSVPLSLVVLFAVYSAFTFAYVDLGTQANAIKDYEFTNEEYAAPYKVKDFVVTDMEELYWSKLPESQREILENNWTLIFDETVPVSMQPSFTLGGNTYDKTDLVCGGLTYTQKRLVFVNTRLEYSWFQNSYIHEFGHVVSYELGTLHGSPEWEILYHQYKDLVPEEYQGYYTSDAAEFFAYSYAEYFINGEELQETMPAIYNYMDEVNHTEINDAFLPRLLTGMKGIVNLFIFQMV